MPNIIGASIYLSLLIVICIILVGVLIRSKRLLGDWLFAALCLIIILWLSANIASAMATNEATVRFFWHLILIFVALVPPVLMMFMFDFYGVNLKRPKLAYPFLFSVPVVNIAIALTSSHHKLVFLEFNVTALNPVQELFCEWGPWFWVHTIWCYAISVAIVAVVFKRHFYLPSYYRLPSTLMSIGISLTLVGNVVNLLQLLPAVLDPTLIGTCLALILFNFAIINNDNSKFIRYSLGRVLNYLDLYILVADEAGRVVHINRPMLDWFLSKQITVNSQRLDLILEHIIARGELRKGQENEKGNDIYFNEGPMQQIMHMYVQKLVDSAGDIIGSIAILTDVTQNRLLLNRLEEKAGMDALTGIANRMAYEGALKRLDSPEHLPLTVIVCDVNDLKVVNDTLGHQFGDMMLQVISELLEEVCPKNSFVARIGGDEFVLLLAKTSASAAVGYMDSIWEKMASRDDLPFTLSAALGAATKENADTPISEVIALADQRMYSNKRLIKAQQAVEQSQRGGTK